MSQYSEFIDAVDRVFDRRACDLRVCMPARVVSYDASKQVADVQPVIRDTRSAPDFEEVVTQLPVITHVPVVFPGAGGQRLLFHPAAGDEVLLVFSDVSLDTWAAQGGDDVDPRDARRHHLADAFAVLGGRPANKPWQGADVDGCALGKDGGVQVVVKNDGKLHLGADNLTELVAIASRVENAINALVSTFNSHTHTVATTGTSNAQTGTAAPTLSQASQASGIGSQTVKVKP